MAEDEIIKHTKAAFNALKNPETGWKHKLQEILTEIFIIVFAITISIWLHNWSDKLHDSKEEKEFLTGLKKDLQSDIENIKSGEHFYAYCLQGMKYFTIGGLGEKVIKDSVDKYSSIFFSSTTFDPHSSRYEGLKGSGIFGVIENKELLNSIINLHEATILRITELNKVYWQYKEKLENFIEGNAELSKTGSVINSDVVLVKPQMRILMSVGSSMIKNNVIPAYKEGIDKCNELIKEVDKELK